MDDLKEYITKKRTDKVTILLVSIVFMAVGFFMIMQRTYIVGTVLSLLGLAALYGGFTAGKTDASMLKKLQATGELDAVVGDFRKAQSFVDDKVRFGEKYIYRFKNSQLIAYNDIASVRYCDTLDESSTNNSHVYYVMVGFKGIPAYPLYSVNYDHPEAAQQMINLIKAHNPNVVVKD